MRRMSQSFRKFVGNLDLMENIFRFFLRLPQGLLSIIAVSLLLILTLLPSENMPQEYTLPQMDKVAHGLMFGLVCQALIHITEPTSHLSIA